MALDNYHNSRGKVNEANEDQEMDSDEEERRRRKKEQKKKKKAKKSPKKTRERDEEEIRETKKKKIKIKPKEEEDDDDEKDFENEYHNEDENENEEEEEERPEPKQATKLRAQKKPNLKISTNEKNISKSTAVKTSSGVKPKLTSSNAPKTTKPTKVSNTIRVPGSKPASRPITKPSNKLATSASTRMMSSGNAANKIAARPQRKASQDAKVSSRTKIPKKAAGVGNIEKKKQTSSVGKRQVPGKNTQEEQSQEFKKILAKNKIDKIKSENDKTNCLLYIISDYFKMKELDEYFKDVIDNNPIFQNFSSKILANIRVPKEFTLKKLNGTCKYISAGDKSGFYTFNNIKNKVPKNDFENLKALFNNLQKQPLQNLNEKEIENFCKTILEIPELSVQTTKSFLKYCE